eukprot:CAMPEP_0116043164 /NCGR_PEP_ID=MMETSP0321-20121206/26171_1 /TAXON_ID=163516 /ORGANISM="Leptocylindrus danicus var. danicus, Strain B650" /LENGTH=483 /DNA_ID=CAMNT_0003523877 /DNA_START=353 /DNA_END=1805 /DNA_ORIENTATION=-
MSCCSITTRLLLITTLGTSYAFTSSNSRLLVNRRSTNHLSAQADSSGSEVTTTFTKALSSFFATVAISASLFHGGIQMAYAEDELAAKYGGGLDTSLVVACLADDPSCRKGLTCTAKCLGDNACITGCMARYGNSNLDNLLKCTIEDNECIKIAILPGGADKFEEAPRPPAPTVQNFDLNSLSGTWYKVVGYNPNYDCYACQRNSFRPQSDSWTNDKLEMDVEFSMVHLLPDGSPVPPRKELESIAIGDDGLLKGSKSIGLNEYATHEVMMFDGASDVKNKFSNLVLGKGKGEKSYSRTAHSEGEMFGLKFWENWYIIGENEPGEDEFKFVYYNGKTRQNTYEGAFVYSRTKDLSPKAMEKVYAIADEAGLQPNNFCKIQNGCFKSDERLDKKSGADYPFRGILASTKVSQFFGVQPVVAEGDAPVLKRAKLGKVQQISNQERSWWYEVGDYLENPRRHFEAMQSQRIIMDWPDYIKNKGNQE